MSQPTGPSFGKIRENWEKLRQINAITKSDTHSIQSAADFMAQLEYVYGLTFPGELQGVTMDDNIIGDGADIKTPYLSFDYSIAPAVLTTQAGGSSIKEPKPIYREMMYNQKNKETYYARNAQFITNNLYIKIISPSKKELYQIELRIRSVVEGFREIWGNGGCKAYWLGSAKPTLCDSIGLDTNANSRLYYITMNFMLYLEWNTSLSQDVIKRITTSLISIDEEDVINLRMGNSSLSDYNDQAHSFYYKGKSKPIGPITKGE